MRSDDSDGISIYGQQPNEVSLSEEGRVQKALQVVEGIYVDPRGIDTVIKANGAKIKRICILDSGTIILSLKLKKTVVLLIQILMWNILVRSTPSKYMVPCI